MRILGIQLHAPSRQGLIALAIVGPLFMLFATGMVYFGLLDLPTGMLFATASISAMIANLCGVSLVGHGWRGWVLSLTFFLGLAIAVLVVYLLFGKYIGKG